MQEDITKTQVETTPTSTPTTPEKVEDKKIEDKKGDETKGLLTQEQFNSALKERLDRKDKEFEEKAKKLVEDAVNKTKMTQEQREEASRKEEAEKLENGKRQLHVDTLTFNAKQLLAESKLDPEFVNLLGITHEDTDETIAGKVKSMSDYVSKTVEKRAQERVAELMRGDAPKDPQNTDPTLGESTPKNYF